MADYQVDFQARVTQTADGTGDNASYIDCTHLQVDDLVVIGHWYRVTGGGNNWYNKFSGSASEYSHANGPFVRSDLFIGGPSLSGREASSITLGNLVLYTHRVVDTDLTDAAPSSQGTLQRFGWHSTAPYSSALAMWTLRGVSDYASSTSETYQTDEHGALTPNTNLLNVGIPSRLQLVFGMAVADNQAASGGPFGTTTVSNKDADAEWDVLVPAPTQHTSIGNYVNISFQAMSSPSQANASNVQYTHTLANNAIAVGNGAMTGLLSKITFADDVGQPKPQSAEGAIFQSKHLTVKELPYDLRDSMRGIDLLGREQ